MSQGTGRGTGVGTTFVLVHGAWRGGWVWHLVAEELERAGHRVIAPTMPGLAAGDDPLSVHLTDAIDALVGRIEGEGLRDVVLVAQDWGSFPATAAANRTAGRITRIIHWCGFIPLPGESFLDAIPGPDAEMLRQRAGAGGGAAVKVPWERWRDNFLHTAPDEIAALTYGLLRPHPLTLMAEPLSAADAAVPDVPTTYLVSDLDRSLERGEEWWSVKHAPRLGVEPVLLEADFSPTFTAPDLLAGHLLAAADR